MNANELRQRLRNHSAAGEQRLLALGQRDASPRHERTSDRPEPARRYPNFLELGDMERIGLVGDRWKIACAFAGLLLLVFDYLQPGDFQDAILADGKVNGFGKSKTARLGGVLRHGAERGHSGKR